MVRCYGLFFIRAQPFSGGMKITKNHQLIKEISGLPDDVGTCSQILTVCLSLFIVSIANAVLHCSFSPEISPELREI